MPNGDFTAVPVSVCPAKRRLYRTARVTTTIPRPPPTSALVAPGEITGTDVELCERGAGEGALPGTARSIPGRQRKIVKRWKSPNEYEPSASVLFLYVLLYCCSTWLGCSKSEWIGRCVGVWLGGSFCMRVSAFARVGGGPVLKKNFLRARVNEEHGKSLFHVTV